MMKLWVARILGVWVQKTRMDPAQCRLAVIYHDLPFIDARINYFQRSGAESGHSYLANVTFVCLFASFYHSKLGFTDHCFDGIQVFVYVIER